MSQNKINIFYHIFLYDKINLIVTDQLKRLIDSDLIYNSNLNITILDNFNKKYELDDFNVSLLKKISNNIFYETEKYYEIITLKKMYDHANLNDSNYLYMHTKGSTRINDENKSNVEFMNKFVNYSYKNVENWRHIMEYFNIDHWKICNDNLQNYDLIGCNYMKKDYLPGIPGHYSGNMWWSKSDFLKKLPDPQNYLFGQLDFNRFNAEFWIGRIKHHALCLFPLPEEMEKHNRCYVYTDKQEYFNKITKNEYMNE